MSIALTMEEEDIKVKSEIWRGHILRNRKYSSRFLQLAKFAKRKVKGKNIKNAPPGVCPSRCREPRC
jgi:hypothetical protein